MILKLLLPLLMLGLVRISYEYFDNEISLECKGTRYENVTLTAYFPDWAEDSGEQGYQDKGGNILKSLQDYMDDRSSFVTVAMDKKLGLPYGTRVCIPELNKHFGHRINFEVRDSSSDLDGSGYTRVDVCVRTEIDSYDQIVNRMATLVFL